MTVEEEKSKSEKEVPAKLSTLWNELYVDLLGSLVPGLFAVILGSTFVLLTACTIYSLRYDHAFSITEGLTRLKDLLAQLHYEIATVTLVSSYIIGTVFFRQDPKRPDSLSALRVWMSAKPEERPGLAVQDHNVPIVRIEGCASAQVPRWNLWMGLFAPRLYLHSKRSKSLDSQFPYLYMRCYLAARGLTHLLRYIPWCPEQAETRGYRTKMFINILKIRLSGFGPRFMRDVVRNEAHVRLATSVWYACLLLFRLGVMCLLILGGFLLYYHRAEQQEYYFAPIVFTSVVVALCAVMTYQLRKCIHYMRVREVVYVLESAYLASKTNSAFDISDLIGNECSIECRSECKRAK